MCHWGLISIARDSARIRRSLELGLIKGDLGYLKLLDLDDKVDKI